jgi:hypothetical protein
MYGFGLVNRFIDDLQVVTTNNYNTVTISTFYKSLHAKSSPACNVLTRRFLVTASSSGVFQLHALK